MTIFQYYLFKVLKQDLLTKFLYNNVLEIPSLNKIVLSFGTSQTSLRKILPVLASMVLISQQKACLTRSKQLKLILKTQAGVAVGCKVDLRGKLMYLFFEKLVFSVLPRVKTFQYSFSKNNFSLKIENLFLFKELEKEYEYFQDLPMLNVHFNFSTLNFPEAKTFLLALKFPLNKND